LDAFEGGHRSKLANDIVLANAGLLLRVADVVAEREQVLADDRRRARLLIDCIDSRS
jgi:hypothetical protein